MHRENSTLEITAIFNDQNWGKNELIHLNADGWDQPTAIALVSKSELFLIIGDIKKINFRQTYNCFIKFSHIWNRCSLFTQHTVNTKCIKVNVFRARACIRLCINRQEFTPNTLYVHGLFGRLSVVRLIWLVSFLDNSCVFTIGVISTAPEWIFSSPFSLRMAVKLICDGRNGMEETRTKRFSSLIFGLERKGKHIHVDGPLRCWKPFVWRPIDAVHCLFPCLSCLFLHTHACVCCWPKIFKWNWWWKVSISITICIND